MTNVMGFDFSPTRRWGGMMAAGIVALSSACADERDAAAAPEDVVVEEEAADPLAQQAATSSWCAVKQIMDKSCAGCHDGKGTGGSPMGLTKHADFLASAPISTGKKVYQAVSARVHDSARPMPPRGLLPAADLQKIDAWVAAGAPAGSDATCAGSSGPSKPVEDWPCDEVYELRAKSGVGSAPYSVGPGETHPQIRHDAPWGSTRVQAIGFKPITDNGKVLHHWILYAGMTFLTGWAPGDDERAAMPDGVGMDMPTGAGSLRLDMHYYNVGGGATQDRSGVSICVVKGSKLRPNVAAVTMGLTSFGPILAPANKRGHNATSSCRVTSARPVTILTASPHAHKYATHMKFTVRKANGREIVMHDMPFKFGEQASYALNPPVVVENGDTITTTCTFDNNTNRNITFGESTENEMCFNFAMYYPKGGLNCGLGGLLGR
jgi:cytochrome c5